MLINMFKTIILSFKLRNFELILTVFHCYLNECFLVSLIVKSICEICYILTNFAALNRCYVPISYYFVSTFIATTITKGVP